MNKPWLSGLILLAAATSVLAGPPLLAFPGAQGYAAYESGGRGGSVYRVTNLNDSGAGSFRDAVSQGHRIVVFDVGGYIELKSPVQVSSDITIAGQTAPGEGIGTKNCEISFSHSHNVIVRFIRFRQGNTPKEEKKSAVDIYEGNDQIFDHVSIEWGRWDTVDMNKGKDFTFQYCIIGQGVSPQRFGSLCQCSEVTWTHCLWINNQSRNPKAKGVPIQFINNVIYNWGGAGGFVEGHSAADSYDDVVGNYFIAGPSSSLNHAFAMGTPTDHVYSSGNLIDLNRDGVLNGVALTDAQLGDVTVAAKPYSSLSANNLQIHSPTDAYAKVVAGVGCSLHRDAIDQALIDQVKSVGKSGKVVEKDISEIGGPGTITGGPAAVCTAGDGVADEWKVAHHLDVNKAISPTDSGIGGYTVLENYLNDLATPTSVQ